MKVEDRYKPLAIKNVMSAKTTNKLYIIGSDKFELLVFDSEA